MPLLPISPRWESFSDIVEDGVTGLGYAFDDASGLEETLLNSVADTSLIENMKVDCLKQAESYLPSTAVEVLMQNFAV